MRENSLSFGSVERLWRARMKFQTPPGDTTRLLLAAILMTFPALVGAQTEQPTPALDPLAGIPVQVLDQQQVDMGDHIVTLNRIAPPPIPTPTPLPVASNPAPPPVGPNIEKLSKVVSFSVDQQNQLFTEVRAPYGAKPELRVHLNVDFRLLRSVSQLETSNAYYMYILAFAFDSADAEANGNIDPPDPTLSLPDHAFYTVTAGNTADYPDVLGGLDALCAYFDANRIQLVADFRKRRDAADLASSQPPTPTPAPRDMVINYWPIKGSAYLNQTH